MDKYLTRSGHWTTLSAHRVVQREGRLMGHTIRLTAIGAVVHGARWPVVRRADEELLPRQLAPIVRLADGGMLGLVVYGVYDFTNDSTLRQWPFVLALVDVAWGVVASAACAAVVRSVAR
jgi:hypothetical protein